MTASRDLLVSGADATAEDPSSAVSGVRRLGVSKVPPLPGAVRISSPPAGVLDEIRELSRTSAELATLRERLAAVKREISEATEALARTRAELKDAEAELSGLRERFAARAPD